MHPEEDERDEVTNGENIFGCLLRLYWMTDRGSLWTHRKQIRLLLVSESSRRVGRTEPEWVYLLLKTFSYTFHFRFCAHPKSWRPRHE
jgi:hypothetical protein